MIRLYNPPNPRHNPRNQSYTTLYALKAIHAHLNLHNRATKAAITKHNQATV